MSIQILDKVKRESDFESMVNLTYQSFKKPSNYKSIIDAEIELGTLLYEMKHKLLFAYDSEKFVGFAFHGWGKFEEHVYKNAAYATGIQYTPNSATISMIAVTPEERRKGVGKKLVEMVMEESKKSGAQHIYVTCFGGKEGSSYSMFKSLGYQDLSGEGFCYQDGSKGVQLYKEL